MGSPTLPPPRRHTRPANTPYLFVSVADLRQSNAPNAIISTLGLGSCLGITCYDPATKAGAMLHAMLPDSKRHRAPNPQAAMYLDLGIPAMLDAITELDADPRRLVVKVFGGAQILQANDYFSIGRQNVEMMKELAARHRLKVVAWDIGGQCNRSIDFYLNDGRVLLRMPNRPEVWL